MLCDRVHSSFLRLCSTRTVEDHRDTSSQKYSEVKRNCGRTGRGSKYLLTGSYRLSSIGLLVATYITVKKPLWQSIPLLWNWEFESRYNGQQKSLFPSTMPNRVVCMRLSDGSRLFSADSWMMSNPWLLTFPSELYRPSVTCHSIIPLVRWKSLSIILWTYNPVYFQNETPPGCCTLSRGYCCPQNETWPRWSPLCSYCKWKWLRKNDGLCRAINYILMESTKGTWPRANSKILTSIKIVLPNIRMWVIVNSETQGFCRRFRLLSTSVNRTEWMEKMEDARANRIRLCPSPPLGHHSALMMRLPSTSLVSLIPRLWWFESRWLYGAGQQSLYW